MGSGRKVLIISLMRLGDLIQQGPMIKILKEELSPVEVHVLMSPSFSRAAKYVPLIDEVIELDYNEIILLPLFDAYRRLKGKLDELRNRNYDLVINLTPSHKERYISLYVGGRNVIGPTFREDGKLINSNPWTDYLYSVIADKTFNDFNLCDLFIKIAGFEPRSIPVEFRVGDRERKKARELLGDFVFKKPLVAFQLGASSPERIWPPENFGMLGRYLQENLNASIVLLGVKKEKDLGEKAKKYLDADKTIDLIGKTDLGSLGGVLELMDLLVTNDTGTMHISAGVGTKTVSLFLASAKFRDTGPYAEDHIVIQPDIDCSPCSVRTNCVSHRCHKVISPEGLFYIVSCLLKGEEIKNSSVLSGMQVYKSTFDDEGFLRYFPVFPISPSRLELILLTSRRVWKMFLDKRVIDEESITMEALKVLGELDYYYGMEFQDWDSILDPLDELLAEVSTLEESTEELFRIELSRDARRLKSEGKKLLDALERFRERSVKEGFLQPFFQIFQFFMDSIDFNGGENILPDLWRKVYELKMLIKGQKSMIETLKKVWEGNNEVPSKARWGAIRINR